MMHKSTEQLLTSLVGRTAVVGNATPLRDFGRLIDSYDVVIRFNNYQTQGYETLIGSKTNFRCTTGWHDIEHRQGPLEFTPFTATARESSHLATFNSVNGQTIIAAETDIHNLLPGIPNPSCGLALATLLSHLKRDADLFAFDGFQSPHYWQDLSETATTHSAGEFAALLTLPHITIIGETYPYQSLYEYCHDQHSDYNVNVGVELLKFLGRSIHGKNILEFGAGNGGLCHLLESSGNTVTALEIATNAYERIQCSRKLNESAIGLCFLQDVHDLFISIDVLEHLTENDIRVVLREAARLCGEVLLAISTRPSGLLGPNGENLHLTVRPIEWWLDEVAPWFEVRATPGYGVGQYVLEGPRRTGA